MVSLQRFFACSLLAFCFACTQAPTDPPPADANSIYVSAWGWDDETCGLNGYDGCRTITFGLQRAVALARTNVLVQVGNFEETVSIVDGINIQGGYDSVWNQGGSLEDYLDSTHKVEIVGTLDQLENQYITLKARDVLSPTKISNVVLKGAEAQEISSTERSSYTLHLVNADGLTLEHVRIEGGSGSDAGSGIAGGDASTVSANPGGNGVDGEEFSSSCNTDYTSGAGAIGSGNRKSGSGGQGGSMDTSCGFLGVCSNCDARAGTSGSNAIIYLCGNHGCGGGGGAGVSSCQNGTTGEHGRTLHGIGGLGASLLGSLHGQYWLSDGNATIGSLGGDGTGGGGGGGGGGCDDGIDSRGGGGGSGGEGGVKAPSAGQGGRNGGSAFGILAIDTTLTVNDVEIVLGVGGNGGTGGSGGMGQPGGPGGSGGNGPDSGDGGNGGNGGAGGSSGAGGGGSGGSAFGIYLKNSTLVESNLSYVDGTLGTGGAGGFSAGTSASQGGVGENGSVENLVSE